MNTIIYIILGLLFVAAIAIGTHLGKRVPYSRDSYVCSRKGKR